MSTAFVQWMSSPHIEYLTLYGATWTHLKTGRMQLLSRNGRNGVVNVIAYNVEEYRW
jgi:hypothetical protein